MRVAHVSATLSSNGGGIAEVVRQLSLTQGRSSIDAHALGFTDDGEPLAPWGKDCPSTISSRHSLIKLLEQLQCDLFHSHGLWTSSSLVVTRVGRSRKVPWVVSPHGMLDPWALQQSKLKKRLALATFEGRHLGRASCIHALCRSEAESCRALGLRNPIAIISNGIDLPKFPERPSGEVKSLTFLGRIHPKKGLLETVKAWTELPPTTRDRWRFVIAGWGQGSHRAALIEIAKAHNVRVVEGPSDTTYTGSHTGELLFTGPVFGEAKERLLETSDAFILPSYSEGLPMSILEAWAYSLPVLMTTECNLPEGFIQKAALQISHREEDANMSVKDGLSQLLAMTRSERQAIGQAGRTLVEQQFTWAEIARKFESLYKWILGEGEKPQTLIETS